MSALRSGEQPDQHYRRERTIYSVRFACRELETRVDQVPPENRGKIGGQTGRTPIVWKIGKSGTDGTYPNFFDQAAEVRLSWWESGAAFFARPLFLAASGRRIEASNAATNSGVPSGRPV